MAIKCQHQQHDDLDSQTNTKKTFLEEENPKGASLISAGTAEKYELQHVKNDWFEKGKDQLTIHLYVKDLNKDVLNVCICEDELNVQFSTSDDKFLNMYQGTTENTLFNWNVKLRGKIDVENSSYKFLKYMIEVNLKKLIPERWGSLQKPNFQGNQSNEQENKEFKKLNAHTQANNIEFLNGESHKSSNNNSSINENSENNQNQQRLNDKDNGIVNGHLEETKTKMSTPSPPEPPPMPQVPKIQSRHGVVGGGTGLPFSDAIRNASGYKNNDNIDHDVEMNRIPDGIITKGFTGLENLGNTCYMNSIIQCLANTRLLRDFFLSGEYRSDLNADNPLSFGGKLAVVFAHLMKQIWSGKSRHVAPQQLKTLLGEKICQFRGFMQQDAQEFMSFLLDGLHEDLNRILKKPYTEEVEGAGRPDSVVAEEAWYRYKSRNDSIVVDLFQGQLKSKLTCPVCKKISIKFDPFMNLSVPLPKEQKLLNVVLFFKDSSRAPMKLTVKVCQDGNLEQLTTAVERKTGVREENMRVVEEFQGKFHKFFEKGSSLTNVMSTDNIYVFEVLSAEEAGEEVYEVPVMQRLLYPLTIPLHCADCYKNQDPNEPLRRCVGCYAIGYCNRKCQERHWPMHKKLCKTGGKHAIGKPFIISMPASQATFTRLKDLAEEYSKHSVDVRDGETIDGESSSNSDKDKNVSDESYQESLPRFFFKPVNIHGEPVMGKEGARLTDNGDEVLDLSNKMLGLDWRNNPKARDWVMVKAKVMECEQHPSYENEEIPASYTCSLRECLELYTEPETLGKDDAWYCPKCKVHREATKQLNVWRLPEILIIHLKRFSFRNILYRDKITKLVEFPVRGLDMTDFTMTKQRSDDNIYDLFAVSNHMGTVNFGHYTAYGRIPNPIETVSDEIGWRYFDDRVVSGSIEDRVVSKCAYVLFYQRRKSFQSIRQPFCSTSTFSQASMSMASTSTATTSGNSEDRQDSHVVSEEKGAENESLNLQNKQQQNDLKTEDKKEDCQSNDNESSDSSETDLEANGNEQSVLDQSEVDECELD